MRSVQREDSRARPAPRADTGSPELGAVAASSRTHGMRGAWRTPRNLVVGLFVRGTALAEGAAGDWGAAA